MGLIIAAPAFPFLFSTRRVASGTVSEIGYALFPVLAFDSGGIVLVAGVAGIAGESIGMAHTAIRRPVLPVVEWESVWLVEGCRSPGSGSVTTSAVGIE